MTFNLTRKSWVYLLDGRRKPPFASLRRNLVYVRGRPGALLESTDVNPLLIEQPIGFIVHTPEHELQIIDDLKRWLITKEPVPLEFDDEPGRTYFAVVQNSIEDFERMVSLRQGTIQFLCPDPYSYGEEKYAVITSGASIVHNNGIEEADPIFELEVVKHSTFALIQNQDDEYQMIGEPTDVEHVPFVGEQLLLHSRMNTTNGWTNGTQVDNGSVSGVMISTSNQFVVQNFGSSSDAKWHGPALKTSLTEQLLDFKVDLLIENLNGVSAVGRVELYLLDANNEIIARIAMTDAWRTINRNRARSAISNGNRTKNLHRSSETTAEATGELWNNFDGVIRLQRVGQEWMAYVAKVNEEGIHYARETKRYFDAGNTYMQKVAQIQVHIGKFGDGPHGQLAIKDLKVWKINRPENHLHIPYILYPGDILTFDHKNDDILLNGESRPDLKQFGASYFKLKPGQNVLVVEPNESFTPRLRYRERY